MDVSEITADSLRPAVEHLAGTIGERNVFRPRKLEEAATWIEVTWQDQGFVPERQWYVASGVRCRNISVTVPGTVRPEAILLIGAHYDSIAGGPGANDNGSGVVAMLALSRLFRDAAPEMTVKFVAFVNEEPPFFDTRLQGADVYARAARERGDDIRLMVALETIGYFDSTPGSQNYPFPFGLWYPSTGNFIGLVSDFPTQEIMHRLAELFRSVSDFPLEHCATFRSIPGVSWSDHAPFWRAGYRALMVTDTAPYRYPHYHLPSDTPDKLDYAGFAEVTRGLALSFRKLVAEEF